MIISYGEVWDLLEPIVIDSVARVNIRISISGGGGIGSSNI